MKKYLRLQFAAVAVAFTVFDCAAARQETGISEGDLKSFFETLVVFGTNYVLTFKKSGGRYAYIINDDNMKVSQYGQSITFTDDSRVKILDRHLMLTFSPLPEKQGGGGFSLSFKQDFRSMGADVTTNFAYLVTSPDEPKGRAGLAASDEKRCLVGLKLVPARPEKQGTECAR